MGVPLVELPSYRAFMLAAVPQLLIAAGRLGPEWHSDAIREAEQLWSAISAHVDAVAAEVIREGGGR